MSFARQIRGGPYFREGIDEQAKMMGWHLCGGLSGGDKENTESLQRQTMMSRN